MQIVEMTRPWTLVVDTREKRPWFQAPVRVEGRYRTTIVTQPIKTAMLTAGDYSVGGMERIVAIERKSCSDLLSTITRGRKRFEKALARLQEFQWSAVIVECDWGEMVKYIHKFTNIDPNSVDGSILAWLVRFPTVHWIFRTTRALAEVTAWKALDRVWQETEEAKNVDGENTSIPA